MRIACYHNLPSGGAKRVVYEHCHLLREYGHEIVVYEPGTADDTFCSLTGVADRVVRIPLSWRATRGAGDELARLPGTLQNSLIAHQNYRRLTRMAIKLAEEIDEGGFDLLYVHHDLFETAPSLMRYVCLPSVYFCQEPARGVFESPLVDEGPSAFKPQSERNLWKGAIRGAISFLYRYRLLNERANTRAATMVLANSVYSAESILRAHGCVPRLCRLGVRSSFFSPGVSGKGSYVMASGGFHRKKGFHFLIKALGLISSNQRPPLVLVGDRSEAGEISFLQELARLCGVSLTIHERVSDEVLRDLYRGAQIFLCAPYLEPFGLVALEAMACGTPVLGVREGGVKESVLEGVSGSLVEREERQFASALEEMLSNRAALEKMGRQAVEYVCQQWTWELSVQRLLELFDEVCRQCHEPGRLREM